MIGIFKKRFHSIKEEFLSYSRKEQAFIFFAMLCGFFICCEYSIIRPVCNSLFIYHFSTKLFPYAWLAIVPINFALVSLYNRLIPKWGSQKLFVSLILLVLCTNTLFGFFAKTIPLLTFFFYMWKEIYVLMMFQLVWSVIHANVKLEKAKYLYGFFFGIGGLGSMLGSSFPGFFAVSYGSERIIFLSLPVYLSLLIVYWKMSQYCSGDVPNITREKEGGFFHGIQLIRRSRFLIFALLIVMFMQLTVAITDFQFNDLLEKTFPEKDVRTEYSARILGAMHSLTVFAQFIGTYLLLKWLGFRRSHYFVPAVLSISASVFFAFPVFAFAGASFVACKSLDFSVFGVIKEMLYVPLKSDEKFRAKAIIDVFAYRSAKALASIVIIFITGFVSSQMLTIVNISIAFLWILSISYGLREYEKTQEIS